MKHFRFVLAAAVISLVTAISAQAEPGWLTDYQQAQQLAKANHKLLLLDFTGSDWCGWCIRLRREVFSKPEFQQYANKNLVLMEVDFPRQKQQTETVRLQNEKLARQYGIQGFPTILVLNDAGQIVGALGYVQGGPNAFVAELEKLRKS
ncbi:MAG: thioredoxin family protein [Verrucomicrobiota bacterium]|nr:thioredoxin family protein [Verrucomicrobiota bacterium]